MKRYLGSKMTAFSAIVAPFVFLFLPLVFVVIALTSKISVASSFIAIMCISCIIIFGIYLNQIKNQLYSCGKFEETRIQVKTIFLKKYVIDYGKCRNIGIGIYTHGGFSSGFGPRFAFIYFSYDDVENKYKTEINFLKPSKTCVKVGFDLKLYNYLLQVLPKRHAYMLQRDYETYILNPKPTKSENKKTKKKRKK